MSCRRLAVLGLDGELVLDRLDTSEGYSYSDVDFMITVNSSMLICPSWSVSNSSIIACSSSSVRFSPSWRGLGSGGQGMWLVIGEALG